LNYLIIIIFFQINIGLNVSVLCLAFVLWL